MMKILFGLNELEISDYYDTAEMRRDKSRRISVTLEDSRKSVDEISEMFEKASCDPLTIVRNGESTVYNGFTVSEINKSVDGTSERISITFIKEQK